MVCNHTYDKQLFLVYNDGRRTVKGFYDGLWIFDGKDISHIEDHTGVYLISIADALEDQGMDPIYLRKSIDNRYKQY